MGVAVTWFGPRSWRFSVTPAPPDDAAGATDEDVDEYQVAATVFVDFDDDPQGRRVVRLASEPMPEPDVSAARMQVGAEIAVEIGHTLASGLGAVSVPTTGGEDAATSRGLSRPAPRPDPVRTEGATHVTTLRTLLDRDEIVDCLRDVPFERRSPPGKTPVVFVVGDSGHAARQIVTLTVAGGDGPGTSVLVSYLVAGSGDAFVDSVTGTRAGACAETVCAAILAADRWAVRDDSSEDRAETA